MKLEGKVAVVTGAGRNIGEAVCHTLAGEGAAIVAVDLNGELAAKVAADITEAGGKAVACVADVSDEADVQRIVAQGVDAFGRLDILINNVAISDNKTIFDITKDEWDKVMKVTLGAPFLMGKYVGKQMADQGQGGVILNVASTSGWRGRPRAIAYTAAKGGVINLTRSMAVQLAPYGIRVNGISPNKIGSPVGKDSFDPNRPVSNLPKRPGEPEDVASVVLFMVTDESGFIWGENVFVDGGTSIMAD